MTTTETVDVAGLVEAGLLSLEAVGDVGGWDRVRGGGVATYTARVYGEEGDEPGKIDVVLESATICGVTVYRWIEMDEAGCYERGPAVLDEDEARAAGEEHAAGQDETPDLAD